MRQQFYGSNEIENLIVISDENTEQMDSEHMTTNSNRERSVLAPLSQPQRKKKKRKNRTESSLSTVSNIYCSLLLYLIVLQFVD